MNTNQLALWESIKNFKFEQPNAALKFSTRLARENGWSQEFADRVILEYKKFIFMCCVSPQGKTVTPSDEVDQAWHLHLTYTKSYWTDLTAITGRQIHHNPTEGGAKENIKYDNQYSYTRELYESLFGEKQPDDIWLPNEKRFADRFERVNIKDNWVIRKPKFLMRFAALLSIFITVLACSNGTIFTNAKQKEEDDFWFWFWLVVAVIGLILLIIWITSPPRRRNGGGSSGSSDSGCSSGGGWFIFSCGSSSSDSHSSGCSSGSSGCGSSGCGSSCGSGCGGGCGSS